MDDTTEMPLHGGWVTCGVVRIGRTVRRPRGPNAPFVETLLRFLEEIGFKEVPRHLGIDEQGRDILGFVEGHVPSDCAGLLWSDAQLVDSMTLLRRFHDATDGSPLAGDAEVVCHGDYGPWNLIWRDEKPVAIIDFDNAAPGRRLDDVGYAVWKHLNLGLLPLDAGEQAWRMRVAERAYGCGEGTDVVAAVNLAQEAMKHRLTEDAPTDARGGALLQLAKQRTWLRANADKLRDS